LICLPVFFFYLAQKTRDWAALANFSSHFAGECVELDFHGLYALSRVGNFEEFRRVLSVSSLPRAMILDLATTIEWEEFCHPDSATFARNLRESIDMVCSTPQMLSPRRSESGMISDDEERGHISQLRALSFSDDGGGCDASQEKEQSQPDDSSNKSDTASEADQHPAKKRPRMCFSSTSSSASSSDMPSLPPPRPPPRSSAGPSGFFKNRLSLRRRQQ
jgi:hypothetical protein